MTEIECNDVKIKKIYIKNVKFLSVKCKLIVNLSSTQIMVFDYIWLR